MSYAIDRYVGDGVTTIFSLSFPYISKSHVKVYIDGVDTAFTWVTDSSVQVASPPAVDAVVAVKRDTPKTVRLVDFENSAILVESSLDGSAIQSLYITQEAFDTSEESLLRDINGNYDALTKRIINVATPTAGGDAVNKTYCDAIIVTAAASAAAALVSETNAAASEAAASASETAAAASQAAAAISETNAAASQAAAGLSETAAGLSETNAAASQAAASASETTAVASAAAALVSETNAAASESAAAASQSAASASASAASTSETNAAASAAAALASQIALNLPTVLAGDAGHRLKVNSGETGYELYNETVSSSPPSGGSDGDFWFQY